ncbi:MAG: undecaprenyldiphospho-muramoylpentapeptide beta-N-acetylglucosaminyltransferase [Terrimicrobiaceae bacterium]|nr:undecaprenyldiphospho-muramoylpentapeptide beta-N-acetylglucosaminyltransferase [Terrimicrobiaceae bacterium]
MSAGLRVVIACGGTGGHLFPGLAVGEILRERGHEVMLIVSEKAIDAVALEGRGEFRVHKLPSAGMPPLLSPAFVRFLRRHWQALGECKALFRRFEPSVVLGMGGFTSTAPLMAARLRGVPSLLHESNAIPGRANRLAARFTQRVLLAFPQCAAHFPKSRCVVTGTPVRASLGARLPREQALSRLRLQPGLPVLLVMGGSQGAAALNQAVFKAVPQLPKGSFQIIHLTGEKDDRLAVANYQREGIPHFVAAFHHAMEELYSAADLVFCRAGAASLSELALFALPSVLVPYPFASDDHQTANAKIFAEAGAAEMIPERKIETEALAVLLGNLLGDARRRAAMAAVAPTLLPPGAAQRVAAEVESAAAGGGKS